MKIHYPLYKMRLIIIVLIRVFLNILLIIRNFYLLIKLILKRIKILCTKYWLLLVKSLLFVLLFCSAVSMTFDYLSYPYIYKLIVSDNNRGFDLPAISFCTERNVFFDKNKINEYFNSSEEYKRNEIKNIIEILINFTRNALKLCKRQEEKYPRSLLFTIAIYCTL